jgi:mRNA interferase MazF
MADAVRRGDVFLVSLDPTRGGEIRKTRPCVIVSPDELNAHFRTFVVAPLTTDSHPYPFRVRCSFQGRTGYAILDQIRTVDGEALVRRLGALSASTLEKVLAVLQQMFAS